LAAAVSLQEQGIGAEFARPPYAHRHGVAAVAALVGKENAPEQCRQLGAALRELGAVEDRTLSKCRMAVRWLKQKARARAVAEGDDGELATKIQAAAQRVLQSN
jgi:hypothetical protein